MLNEAQMPDGDVLVIAGDYAPNFPGGGGEVADARRQLEWVKGPFNRFLKSLSYKKIIVVAGNHDWLHYCSEVHKTAKHAIEAVYLEDSACEIDGVKFYGSPWQPWFWDWAFNFNRLDPVSGFEEAKRVWAKIPDDVNVLITHGPPLNILDLAPQERRVGCPILRDRVLQIKPKLHIFGHIHQSYGLEKLGETTFVNVSLCNERYQPVNPIQVFEV
jgi:Icc-related predicted phosphoesterase